MELGAQFAFFAAIFGALAFVHLWWPHAIKQVVDRVSEQVGGQFFGSEYTEQFYSLMGGFYASSALLMAVAALLSTELLGV